MSSRVVRDAAGRAGTNASTHKTARRAAGWAALRIGVGGFAGGALLAGDERGGERELGAGDRHLDALLLGLLERLELFAGQPEGGAGGLAVLQGAQFRLPGDLALALAAAVEQ